VPSSKTACLAPGRPPQPSVGEGGARWAHGGDVEFLVHDCGHARGSCYLRDFLRSDAKNCQNI
jgi:hypothetical protein